MFWPKETMKNIAGLNSKYKKEKTLTADYGLHMRILQGLLFGFSIQSNGVAEVFYLWILLFNNVYIFKPHFHHESSPHIS